MVLPRKPVLTCTQGFGVKTLSGAQPMPGWHQQRNSQGRRRCKLVMALYRYLTRLSYLCHIWFLFSTWLQQRDLAIQLNADQEQQSQTEQGVFNLRVPHSSNKCYSGLLWAPHPPRGQYDQPPQSFKAGFSDYFASALSAPRANAWCSSSHSKPVTLSQTAPAAVWRWAAFSSAFQTRTTELWRPRTHNDPLPTSSVAKTKGMKVQTAFP